MVYQDGNETNRDPLQQSYHTLSIILSTSHQPLQQISPKKSFLTPSIDPLNYP